MRNILVYGSLRKGEYNYDSFKEEYGDDFQFVKELTLEGYKLYSLGVYPGIKKTNNKEDVLVVNKIQLSEEAYRDVDWMEIGAGYSRETINVDGDDCTLYIYDGHVRDTDLVENGDWSKYETSNIW